MRRALFGLQAAAALLVAERLRHGVGRRPPVAAGSADTSDVSIVIPARNEQARITACIESVTRSANVREIIVVDDGSTDHTAELAAKAGACVVVAGALPDGWIGKPWALQQGLEAATGTILVCLDADVEVHPGAIAALVEQLNAFDVVSFSARLLTSSSLEKAISAGMVTSLVYRFGPVGRRQALAAQRTIGNGQCLAFSRTQLDEHGGFTSAAGNMTDDIALLRSLARAGLSIGFLDGSSLVDVRMYSSAAETWRQWPRSLPMNDTTTVATRALDLATLWLTMALPMVRLLTGRATKLDRVLLVQRVAISAALRGAYENPTWPLLAGPLLDPAVVARLSWTTIRPVRQWRGRRYPQQKSADR